VCAAAVRPRLVGDVVLPTSSADQWRRSLKGQIVRAPRLLASLPPDRRQAPAARWSTSEQLALHETTESLGAPYRYRYSASVSGLTPGQQPALAVVRPTVSRDSELRLSQVDDESALSCHQQTSTL